MATLGTFLNKHVARRIAPTPEDAAIIRRQIDRMFRWNNQRGRLPFDQFASALIRAASDYLELKIL